MKDNITVRFLPLHFEARRVPRFDADAATASQIVQWCDGELCEHPNGKYIRIVRADGLLFANPGDWIVKGLCGKIFVFCEDSFAAHFEFFPLSNPHKCRSNTMDFGQALIALKQGRRVAREGWNGKGMFLFLVPGSTFRVNREPLLSIMGEGAEVQYHAHIDMKTAQGYVVPWLASQADMLAEDWVEVWDANAATGA